MNKKVITGIIAVLVVVIVGFGGYFLLSNKATTDAPTETKQPDEELKVGNEDTKPNKDGKKSLVVYFSVPETDDPNKKMTTEEEKKEKYIMLRNSIKENLKENFILEEEYWQYNKEYSDKIKKIKEDIQLYEEEKETIKNNDTDWMNIFKKKEKINELNRLLIDELIEDIVVSEDGNIKVIFKYEDKYFEALDFINKQKYDIILSN